MGSFNKITIVGYLGRDPELRYTPQGTPVCDFSIATTEKRKDEESTTWFKVVFFGRQAEVANQYLSKGKQVYIEGRLSQREWTTRDGEIKQSLEVTGTDLQFIAARTDSERTDAPQAKAAAAQPSLPDDDVGF